jgi:hypothetical protein
MSRIPASQFSAALATELVTRGALVLDEWAPGWHDVLDLGTLDLRDGTVCVLGQAGSHIWESMGTDPIEFYQLDEWTTPWTPRFNEASDLLRSVIVDFEPHLYGFDFPYTLLDLDAHLVPTDEKWREAHARVWEMLTCAWLAAAAERRLHDDPEGEPPYVAAEIARQGATRSLVLA